MKAVMVSSKSVPVSVFFWPTEFHLTNHFEHKKHLFLSSWLPGRTVTVGEKYDVHTLTHRQYPLHIHKKKIYMHLLLAGVQQEVYNKVKLSPHTHTHTLTFIRTYIHTCTCVCFDIYLSVKAKKDSVYTIAHK